MTNFSCAQQNEMMMRCRDLNLHTPWEICSESDEIMGPSTLHFPIICFPTSQGADTICTLVWKVQNKLKWLCVFYHFCSVFSYKIIILISLRFGFVKDFLFLLLASLPKWIIIKPHLNNFYWNNYVLLLKHKNWLFDFQAINWWRTAPECSKSDIMQWAEKRSHCCSKYS